MAKKPPVIEMTTNHTGKMEGINSISTSVVLNPFCQKQQAVKGSICSHCFAESMMKMYSALEEKLARNTKVLTESILPEEDLPNTTGMRIFRFESFGDLNNEIQLTNYLNIVRKNPSTRFTLWTKRYSLVEKYFTEHDVPDNFTLIISSLMVNTKISLTFLKKTGKFKLGQLKSFTVYDYDYIKEHWKEMDINCGSRFCLGCRLCYDLNDVEEISEVLKADQIRVDKFLKCNDSKLIEEQLELLSDLDDLL